MRYAWLIFLVGCADTARDGAIVVSSEPLPAPPAVPPASAATPATSEAPGGCQYSESIEPVAPALPADDCYREWIGADGVPIQWMVTTTEHDGDVVTRTRATYLAPGALVERTVDRESPAGRLLESIERLDLPPNGTLPNTYGQPATWSRRWIRDDAGRVVREEHDVALDGVLESAEEWDYGAGDVVVEHRRYAAGTLSSRQTFRSDGQPLELLSGASRRVWTYDDAGLLVRMERYHDDVLYDAITWTMLDPERPLEREHRRHETGTLVTHDFWTWDDAGRLRVEEGISVPYGYERHYRREYDERGRVTRFVEDTEDIDCHRYEQVSTWHGDSEQLIREHTTCDGEIYQAADFTLDEAGRPLDFERVYYGNPTKVTRETRRWTRDACGAMTSFESRWDDVVTRREVREHDDLGRITRRTFTYHSNDPTLTEYVYDDAGRVVRMGAQTWEWRSDGRLAATRWEDGAPTHLSERPAVALRFVYACQ